MVRRALLTAAVASIVAAAIGGASLAIASGGTEEDASLRLIEVRTAVNPVDLPPAGPSVGDEFVLAAKLRNASNTSTVGNSNDVCTVLSAAGAPLQCYGVIALKAGTVDLAGNAPGGPSFSLAITGGTGAYDEAGGRLLASPTANGNELLRLDLDN